MLQTVVLYIYVELCQLYDFSQRKLSVWIKIFVSVVRVVFRSCIEVDIKRTQIG